MPQLTQRLRLDLTNAFPRDLKFLADLFQRPRATVIQPKAQLQHLLFAVGQRIQYIQKLLLQAA